MITVPVSLVFVPAQHDIVIRRQSSRATRNVGDGKTYVLTATEQPVSARKLGTGMLQVPHVVPHELG
jgi:hypothetical protein